MCESISLQKVTTRVAPDLRASSLVPRLTIRRQRPWHIQLSCSYFPRHTITTRISFFSFSSSLLLGRRGDKRFNAWRPYASVSPSARKPPASFPQTTISVDPEIPLGRTIVTVPKTVHYLEREREKEGERSTGYFSSSPRSLVEDFAASRRNSDVTLRDLRRYRSGWVYGTVFLH